MLENALKPLKTCEYAVCFHCCFSLDKERKIPRVGIMESLAKSVDSLDGHHLLEVPITRTLSDNKKYTSQPWAEFFRIKFKFQVYLQMIKC